VRTYKRKRLRVDPDKRMAAAVGLRDEGLSLRQTAERLACSYQTVARDLQRWEQANANVVPLSHSAVTKSPHGGQFVTPECDSGGTNIVSMSDRRKQA
jgi:DNA invertase Pin-like site-specific DNA recombinase